MKKYQEHAIMNIIAERNRQDAKWGVQDHEPVVWSAILTEECGEFAEAALNCRFKGMSGNKATNLREEAIHCAAVALAIVEWIDRKECGS